MPLSTRLVALLLLGASLLAGLLGVLLLLLGDLRDARARAARLAGLPERLRQHLGVEPGDDAALDEAAARWGGLHREREYPRLTLRGPPYARGFAHGRLLAPQVRGQIRGFLARVAGTSARHAGGWYGERLGLGRRGQGVLGWLLDLPLVRARARDDFLDEVAAELIPHVPARHRQEMEGLADGAGLDPAKVRRFHAVAEVASAGCSNLAAWGRATVDGRFLQYRNLDWSLDLGVQEHPLLLEHEADGDHLGHLTAGFVGFLGALQGLNQEGITLGEVGAGSRLGTYQGQPMVFRLRRVLEEARDLGDVDRIMAEPNRTRGYNFVIGDLRERVARAYEQNRERTAVFSASAEDPREAACPYAFPFPDVLIRGDFAVDPEIRRQQHAAGGPGDPRGALSYQVRYRLLADGVRRHHGALDSARVEAIARESGEQSRNLVSVLYTEEELRVAYAVGGTRASARPYQVLSYRDTVVLAGLVDGEDAAAGGGVRKAASDPGGADGSPGR